MVFRRYLLTLVCFLQIANLLPHGVALQASGTWTWETDNEINNSDFAELYKNKRFVDKTLFIEKFVNEGDASILVTCPPRFGKSSVINMLKYFFSIRINETTWKPITPNYKMFENLKIFEYKEIVQEYLGKRPVIHLDFNTFPRMVYSKITGVRGIGHVIHLAVKEHKYLLQSEALDVFDKTKLIWWLEYEQHNEDVDEVRLNLGVKHLSYCLQKYHNAKCIILVDEFDAPGAAALIGTNNTSVFGDVTSAVVGMLNCLLKGNEVNVERGVLVGISHLFAIEYTKLNNLNEYRFLDNKKYIDYFGLQESEFQLLMNRYNVSPDLVQQAHKFYNGYSCDKKKFYCTYSVMKFITALPEYPKSHWYKTDRLINFPFILAVPLLRDMINTLLFESDGITFHKINHISSANLQVVQDILSNPHSSNATNNDFVKRLYLTMFLEQGYLSVKGISETIVIAILPNVEIKIKLMHELQSAYISESRLSVRSYEETGRILRKLNFTDESKLSSSLLELYKTLSHGVQVFCSRTDIKRLNEQAFRFYLLSMLESASGAYNITPEIGNIDIMLERKEVKEFIFIELKETDNINNAFFQILQQKYYNLFEKSSFIIMALHFKKPKDTCTIEMMYQINTASMYNAVKISFHKNGTLLEETVTVQPTPAIAKKSTTVP